MPRPHIGESLMPETYWVFERLGVMEQLKACSYPKKVGVQFVSNTGKESSPFFFRTHDDRESSETWHVDRDKFDKMLFDNAAAKGADCRDSTRVLEVVFDADRAVGVQIQPTAGPPQKIAARVVVDATGQQAMLANSLGLLRMNPELRKAAIWRYFRGGFRDQRGGGVKTTILHTAERQSWFWYIPMSDDTISVGVVGDRDYLLKGRGTPAEVFDAELATCAPLGEWLAGAEPRGEPQVAKEFSYSTDRSAGEGWVLIGDAWGFLDPVYSSGVFFALKSAELAADCVIAGLRANDVSAETLGRWLPDFNRRAGLIKKMVDAFYSGEFRVGKFVQEYPEHRDELVDLLIGRIFGDRKGQIFEDLEPWLKRAKAKSEEKTP